MKIICVDFQKDYTSEVGLCYHPRPCINFIKKILVPFLNYSGIKIAEIISDYRHPRPGEPFERCIPGEEGYESEIPASVKRLPVWIKCMNSPLWVRDNAGEQEKQPGFPYQAPEVFTKWLEDSVGAPYAVDELILIGLTLDCCILCVAQELCFRGYAVRYLVEAVDCYTGDAQEKQNLLKSPLANWGKAIGWEELQDRIKD
ncbi:hypothetical protein ACFL35_20640 [Candidatus Riflebacteria bacterium]